MSNVFFQVHHILKEVSAIFRENKKQLFLVGGAVRDSLRGHKSKDWDLATDAVPEEVIGLFKKDRQSYVIPTGIKFGTVTVHYKGREMEVTTFRSESGYSDGRRPDVVEFGTSIEADLSRRDFTMNAMAYKLPSGPLIDPFGGREDIKNRVIRCVGSPAERFSEDGLRPMRAIRFACRLGFDPDKSIIDAIPGVLSLCGQVAVERVREELDKMISGPKPSTGFLLMEKTGLLNLLIPELALCRGIEQNDFHRFDVLDHSLLALDYAAQKEMPQEVRLAALFHDIGKPLVRSLVEADGSQNERWTFYRHEKKSSGLTRQLFQRLRYSNAITDRVCHLIENHMFSYDENWSDAAVRRFIVRAGEDNLDDLYRLRKADSFAHEGIEPRPESLLILTERVKTILAQKKALSLKDLAVNGNDLIELGMAPDRSMGFILENLLEAVIEDPELNTKEKLLEIALKIYSNR